MLSTSSGWEVWRWRLHFPPKDNKANKINFYQTTWHQIPEDCNSQVLQQLSLISNVMYHKLICKLYSFTLYQNRETVLCLSLQVMMMWCCSLSRCMVGISFFWNVTKCPRRGLGTFPNPEGEDNTLRWNIRVWLTSDAASYLRRMESSATPLEKPQNLQVHVVQPVTKVSVPRLAGQPSYHMCNISENYILMEKWDNSCTFYIILSWQKCWEQLQCHILIILFFDIRQLCWNYRIFLSFFCSFGHIEEELRKWD